MKFNTKKILNIFIKRKLWTIVIGCCLLVSICLFIFLYQLYVPLNKNVEESIFIIKEGQGLNEIAHNLKIGRIIGNEWPFAFYIWLSCKTDKLQAGKYALSSAMSARYVADKIINGDVIRDWVKVTIPEGWTNIQIEEWLFGVGLPADSSHKFLDITLQGYLFPDTYYFEKESGVEEIVKKMLRNFDVKLSSDLREEIAQQGKTIYEVLIMASILEKEVISDEDRAIVSGIFWKRLKDKYPLQSCATIAYILEVDKWRYTYADTRIKSPYNTYLNIGLPSTPINNPGLSAIKAAIYPKESDYYFFLTDPEDGKTVFSKTFEEHSRNKIKYFK